MPFGVPLQETFNAWVALYNGTPDRAASATVVNDKLRLGSFVDIASVRPLIRTPVLTAHRPSVPLWECV